MARLGHRTYRMSNECKNVCGALARTSWPQDCLFSLASSLMLVIFGLFGVGFIHLYIPENHLHEVTIGGSHCHFPYLLHALVTMVNLMGDSLWNIFKSKTIWHCCPHVSGPNPTFLILCRQDDNLYPVDQFLIETVFRCLGWWYKFGVPL